MVTLTAIAVTPAFFEREYWPKVDQDAAAQLPRIRAALRAALPDSVLLAGNSHAIFAARAASAPCARLIDAGIGGGKARDYAAALPQFQVGERLREAVFLIGTNDIGLGDEPLSAAAREQFAADSARVIAWLQAHAETVTVVAVPPIAPAAVDRREPAAVAVYSAILQGLCRASGCRFADPFAGLRDGEGGLARPQTLVDPVHLADYPALLTALGLCPSQAEASGRPDQRHP